MKKGSRHTLQTRLKMSESIKQVRDKIIATHLGSKRSYKTCENISKGLKRHWETRHHEQQQQQSLQQLQ